LASNHHPQRIVIVGGNLCSGLTALAVRRLLPNAEVHLVSETANFGGNVLLPLCDRLFPKELRWLIEPLVVKKWPGCFFVFPGRISRMHWTVSLLAPEQLHAELYSQIPPENLRSGTKIAGTGPDHVQFASGAVLRASKVLDLRDIGLHSATGESACSISERDCRIDSPHGLALPVLLDAALVPPPHYQHFLQYVPLSENILRITLVRPSENMDSASAWSLAPHRAHASLMGTKDIVAPIRNNPPNYRIGRNEMAEIPLYLGSQLVEYACFAAKTAHQLSVASHTMREGDSQQSLTISY
jgi:hypothetical protein